MIISDASSLRRAIEAFLEDHDNVEDVGLTEDGLMVVTDDGDYFLVEVTAQ